MKTINKKNEISVTLTKEEKKVVRQIENTKLAFYIGFALFVGTFVTLYLVFVA